MIRDNVDMTITDIDEAAGRCTIIYKGNKFQIQARDIDGVFSVFDFNKCNCHNEMWICDTTIYRTYSEVFNSDEFVETFVSNRLRDMFRKDGFSTMYGVKNGLFKACRAYSTRPDEKVPRRVYESKECVYTAFYENGTYYYAHSDSTGDIVELQAFAGEEDLTDYINALPIVLKSRKRRTEKALKPEQIARDNEIREINRQNWQAEWEKEYVAPRPLGEALTDTVLSDSNRDEIPIYDKQPEAKDGILYLSTMRQNYLYEFTYTCIECNNSIILRTGSGRYGNLGGFKCPFCTRKYHATIDDHENPDIHIHII